jgi:hypothetical protein
MGNDPAVHADDVRLGQLLADCLDIAVVRLAEGQSIFFGAGWAHTGSDYLGVTDGDFASESAAYASLAVLCEKVLLSTDERYARYVSPAGREIIGFCLAADRIIARINILSAPASDG